MQDFEFKNRGHNFSKLNIKGIQSPANHSYRQSLYIAAIAEALGYKGLASPVVDVRDGIEYSFDFYHPQSSELVKVFKGYDEEEYCAYQQHDALPILIFDSEFIPCEMEVREYGDIHADVLTVDEVVAEHIYYHPFTYIYHEGNLWKHASDVEGEGAWEPMVPMVLRKYVESSCDDDLPF